MIITRSLKPNPAWHYPPTMGGRGFRSGEGREYLANGAAGAVAFFFEFLARTRRRFTHWVPTPKNQDVRAHTLMPMNDTKVVVYADLVVAASKSRLDRPAALWHFLRACTRNGCGWITRDEAIAICVSAGISRSTCRRMLKDGEGIF